MTDYDILLGKIKTTLSDYSAAQGTEYQFDTKIDYMRELPSGGGATVLIQLGTITADQESRGHYDLKTPVIIDLIAYGKRTKSTDVRADEAAGARVRYLEYQVLNAMFDPDNYDLGMDAGSFQRDGFPTIEPLFLGEQAAERAIAAARMTFDFMTSWEPATVTGTALEELSTDAALWSALITY